MQCFPNALNLHCSPISSDDLIFNLANWPEEHLNQEKCCKKKNEVFKGLETHHVSAVGETKL